MLDQKNQEQITLMAYRDGHLAEIDPNKDLFLKQLVEADIKDRDVESNPDDDIHYVGRHLMKMGFSPIESVGFTRESSHPIWKNGKRYLVILIEAGVGPYAFVKLESHIEYMDFARDYLLPLIELESRSEFYMPKEENLGDGKQ